MNSEQRPSYAEIFQMYTLGEGNDSIVRVDSSLRYVYHSYNTVFGAIPLVLVKGYEGLMNEAASMGVIELGEFQLQTNDGTQEAFHCFVDTTPVLLYPTEKEDVPITQAPFVAGPTIEDLLDWHVMDYELQVNFLRKRERLIAMNLEQEIQRFQKFRPLGDLPTRQPIVDGFDALIRSVENTYKSMLQKNELIQIGKENVKIRIPKPLHIHLTVTDLCLMFMV